MKTLGLLAAILVHFQGCNGNSNELTGKFTATGDGFHKDLKVSFPLPASLDQCTLLLRWDIPSGAYVDPYQLESLTNEHTQFVIKKVDIEQTQHLSPTLTFYQLSKLSCKENCEFAQTLPMHSRYHSPNHGGDPATVDLKPPRIFRSCSHSNLCSNENDPSCGWEPMPVSFPITGPVIQVPVGDLNHIPLVTCLTLLITGLGTTFIAWK